MFVIVIKLCRYRRHSFFAMDKTSLKGYALGIAASVAYGLNPLFALPLYGGGMGTSSVLFWRYFFAVPILGLLILCTRGSFRVSSRQFAALIGLGLLMGFSSLSLFESYRFMEASIASTMLFIYPLMVALIMSAVYREHLTASTWICIALSIGGVAALMVGKGVESVAAPGAMWVLVSALSYAAYLVWVGRPLLDKIPALTLSFYVLLFGFLVFAVVTAAEGGLQVPDSALGWGCSLGLALFPTVVSLVCTTAAVSAIGSSPTAILGVFEPVAGVMVGIGVFGERLSAVQTLGLVSVLSAVSFVVINRKK